MIAIVKLWYFATKKNRLSKSTKIIILSSTVILFFLAIGLGWITIERKQMREQQFIIAIANFYSTNQKDYGVTEDLAYKLGSLLADEFDMVVELLNTTISEAEGRDEAVRKGKETNADVVFWGWYTVTQTNILVTIHIEDLTSESIENIAFGLPESYQFQDNLIRLDTFELQKDISEDFSAIAFFLMGKSANGNGNFNKAIDYYSKAIEKKTHFDEWFFYYERGYTNFAYTEDIDSAILDFEAATDQVATSANEASIVYSALGTSYFYAADFIKAREMQTFALQLELAKEQSDNEVVGTLLYNIANDIVMEEGCEGALDYFSQSLEYAQSKWMIATIHRGRGICFNILNRDQDAISDLNIAIAIFEKLNDPNLKQLYRQSLNNRAEIYYRMGLQSTTSSDANSYYKMAISDYTVAIKVDSNYHFAYLNRGQVHLTLEKFEKAENDFEDALKLAPNDVATRIALSRIYFYQGWENQALEELTIATQLNSPEIADAYTYRGFIYSSLYQDENAINDCSQALLLNSSQEDCYYIRGTSYYFLFSKTNDPIERNKLREKATVDLVHVTQFGEYPERVETAQELLFTLNDIEH